MGDLSLDIHTASEEFLVQLCNKLIKEDRTIGGCFGGDRVVRLTDNVAAKFGLGVTASEAKSQEFAYRNVDPNIVHIPQVYRYFRWEDFGYLFMEYVPGRQLNELDLDENVNIIPRVTRIIEHLGKIQGVHVPGPIGGGMPEGYLWGDDGARTTFTCVADMEAWLTKCLVIRDKSIDLSSHPLVLCHMDLCRRNMILKEDNTISLLDWGCSGFYLRYFEFATLSFMMPYDENYETPLIQAIATLLNWIEDEKALISLLELARAIALRYSLETENKYELPKDFYSWRCSSPMLSRSPSPS
ncbi:07a799ae-f224-4778-a3ff-73c49bdd67dc [Sclerotinia trifoliorum]|uniref:07a799ae-f224-4778-a3ff-73c49bdd67dc n=1 Tax=Sclerotinia trifoliorum TaxID=28548 RepID=A0A8H2VNX0_9HELO|nr:07a799ae-f224-4778-a3ff-73c49bdd67dc [Sclerotinia trifoliorum]